MRPLKTGTFSLQNGSDIVFMSEQGNLGTLPLNVQIR